MPLESCSIYPFQIGFSHLVICISVSSMSFHTSCPLFIFYFFIFKDCIYLFMRDREREREREKQRHRQREKRAPCGEADAGLNPGSPGSQPEPKVDAQPLSPPRRPKIFLFFFKPFYWILHFNFMFFFPMSCSIFPQLLLLCHILKPLSLYYIKHTYLVLEIWSFQHLKCF